MSEKEYADHLKATHANNELRAIIAERDAAVRRAEQAEARVNDLEKQWGEVQLEPCLPTPDTCHTLKAKLGEAVKERDEWDKCAHNLIAEKDALHAKLDASERAAAEMREVLDTAKHYVLNLPLEGTIDVASRIDRAIGVKAGRDYVPRSEVDAAWRRGMTDAEDAVGKMTVAEKYPDDRTWNRHVHQCCQAILAARDKSELPTEPKTAK